MKRTIVGVLLLAGACHSRPQTIVLPATARSGSEVVGVLTAAPAPKREWGAIVSFQPALPAVDGPFECSPPVQPTAAEARIVRLPPNTTSLVGYYPTRANPQATVSVTLDSTGRLLLYGERRGAPLRAGRGADMTPQQRAAELKAMTDSIPSTVISLDARRNQANVTNRGGGRPTESVSGPLDAVVSLEQFGKPLNRAHEVIVACRAPH